MRAFRYQFSHFYHNNSEQRVELNVNKQSIATHKHSVNQVVRLSFIFRFDESGSFQPLSLCEFNSNCHCRSSGSPVNVRSGAGKVPIQLSLIHSTQEYGSTRQNVPAALLNDPKWHKERRRSGDTWRPSHHHWRELDVAAKGVEWWNSNATWYHRGAGESQKAKSGGFELLSGWNLKLKFMFYDYCRYLTTGLCRLVKYWK